jgi:hypothetical protein
VEKASIEMDKGSKTVAIVPWESLQKMQLWQNHLKYFLKYKAIPHPIFDGQDRQCKDALVYVYFVKPEEYGRVRHLRIPLLERNLSSSEQTKVLPYRHFKGKITKEEIEQMKKVVDEGISKKKVAKAIGRNYNAVLLLLREVEKNK